MLTRISTWCLAATLLGTSADTQQAPPPPQDQSVSQDRRQAQPERRGRLIRRLLNLATEATGGQPAAAPAQDADQQENGEPSAARLLRELLPLLTPPGEAQRGPDAPQPIDPAKLNDALAEDILRPLAEELEPVDALELRFDEQRTDFARDQLGLSGRIQLRATPWHDPAKLDLDVFARLERQPPSGSRALIAFDVDLATNMVQLAEFVRHRALRRLANKQDRQTITAEETAYYHLLQSTPAFASFSDVADFLPLMGEVDLRAMNERITQLKAEIGGQDPAPANQALFDQLAKAYRQRDHLVAFSLRTQRDQRLNVQQMTVTLAGGGVSFGLVGVESVDLRMTETSLVGRVEICIGQAGVVLYQGAKALIIEPMLRRLQERDPGTVRNWRRRGRQLGQQLEELQDRPEEIETLPDP